MVLPRVRLHTERNKIQRSYYAIVLVLTKRVSKRMFCIRTRFNVFLRFIFESILNFGRSKTTLWSVILASKLRKFDELLKNDCSSDLTPSILSGNKITISYLPDCNIVRHNINRTFEL